MKKNEKVILILGSTSDLSTVQVSNWLNHYKRKFIIIDGIDDFIKNKICFNEKYFKESIAAVWYRKLNLTKTRVISNNKFLNSSSSKFINQETFFFNLAVETFLSSNRSLGCGLKMCLNKIEVLSKAKKVGLQVPRFLLSTSKAEVLEFSHKIPIITKPIYNAMPIQYSDNEFGFMHTAIVEKETINKLPSTFYPSFFQEFIEKETEVRSFYLDGDFFSAEIHEYTDVKAIDYRALDIKNYRFLPFKLPQEIEEKLRKLMQSLDLNTGSIDLLKTRTNGFYFLEINPSGQYDFLSKSCNYNLDKKIAKWLMS